MTITLDRPTTTAVPAIHLDRTWRVGVAIRALDDLLGRADYANLPDLHGVHVSAWLPGATDVTAQLAYVGEDDAKAAAVLAWRDAVPGGRTSITRGNGYWRAVAHLPAGGTTVEVWAHLHGLTEAQEERLDRQPGTAYAVLVEIARSAA